MIQVDESCGCTLNRADIVPMTPASFEALGLTEIDAQRIIGQERELRLLGVEQSPLKDLLLSRMTGLRSASLGQNNQSIIAPFYLLPQQSVVNSNYFQVSANVATPGAGANGIHTGSRDLTVINDSSQFATSLVHLENYFLVGKYIVLLTQDPTTKVGRTVQFQITASVNADVGSVAKAKLTVVPNMTDAGYVALSATDKAVWNNTPALLLNLANSISNFEAWCHQYPTENTKKLREFWRQTIRRTHCYNDEYLKALNAPLTSEFFKKFRMVPLAEQRRRQGEQEDRDFYNTILYGQRISEKQTANTATDLTQVQDPTDPGCVIEFKANTLGIETQIAECGRVLDFQNGPLDMDVLREIGYEQTRRRKTQDLDLLVDRFTYSAIMQVMIKHYFDKYGVTNQRYYNPGQAIRFNGQVMWNKTDYEFPEEGFELHVMREQYFDDHLAATPAAIKARGRQAWMVDWSDIKVRTGETRSVTRQTNVADDLFNCIIQPNVKHYLLNSQVIAVEVGDPNRHTIFRNFSDHCPEITSVACTPTYA